MKEFPLSTAKERVAGISFSIVMVICFGILLYAVRSYTLLLIICILGILPLTGLLVFYVVSISKSTCFVEKDTMTLEVKGFPSYTRDISQAVLLQTVARKSGHAMTRVLIFSDAEEKIIAAVPTLYTFKQGLQAEPMAKEMAQYLGIAFQANVPAWHYDKEAYQQHLKDEEVAAKAARKERQERRKQKLLRKYNKK